MSESLFAYFPEAVFNSTFRSLKELVKSWFTLSDFPSRCWGGGSGSRGALDQEAKSVKAGVKDNNHPGKNGAVHVITGCTRSRWTIDICRLLHGRVLSKCLVTWQHALRACNVFLRVAQVNCLSHFLVLGLVWRSFYSISGMPVCLMPKCRSRLHERYLQCCGFPDEKVQANDLLVWKQLEHLMWALADNLKRMRLCKCLQAFQPWQRSPLLQISVKHQPLVEPWHRSWVHLCKGKNLSPNKFQCPDDVKRNEKSQSHIS